MRWAMALQPFQFEVIHCPREEHKEWESGKEKYSSRDFAAEEGEGGVGYPTNT